MPKIPTTRTIGAKAVIQELKRQFLNVDKIAKAAGLDVATINREDGWIPFVKFAALIDIAAQETGEEFFGLKLANSSDPRDLGVLGYIGLSSHTLGDALINLERYLAIITDASRIEMSVAGDFVDVRFKYAEASFASYRQAVEFGAGVLVKAYQFFTDCEIIPAKIEFVHHSNGDPQEYTKLLGCPVTFGEKNVQIVLNRSDVATPIATTDYRLLRILTDLGDDILQKNTRGKPEHIIKLERHIVDLLPKGQAKAKIVAVEMGMSERSLVRKLAEMETSFSEILNRLRHELALRYLSQPELNLTQVSFLLGYANPSAFSTAFKRTTGIAPKDMRASA